MITLGLVTGPQFWQQGCDDAKAGLPMQILDLSKAWDRDACRWAYRYGYQFGHVLVAEKKARELAAEAEYSSWFPQN